MQSEHSQQKFCLQVLFTYNYFFALFRTLQIGFGSSCSWKLLQTKKSSSGAISFVDFFKRTDFGPFRRPFLQPGTSSVLPPALEFPTHKHTQKKSNEARLRKTREKPTEFCSGSVFQKESGSQQRSLMLIFRS